MMEKAIFYDVKSGLLARCMFVGLDSLGRAQWLDLSQREKTEVLNMEEDTRVQDYFDYRLLCLEGEKAESLTIAHFLASTMNAYHNVNDDLQYGLDALRKMDVRWRHDALEMKAFVEKYRNKEGVECYLLRMLAGYCILATIVEFDDLDTVLYYASSYMRVLEQETHIIINKKTLVANEEILAELDVEDKLMFDKITQMK